MTRNDVLDKLEKKLWEQLATDVEKIDAPVDPFDLDPNGVEQFRTCTGLLNRIISLDDARSRLADLDLPVDTDKGVA